MKVILKLDVSYDSAQKPEDVRKTLLSAASFLANRGFLTEGLDCLVSEWSSSVIMWDKPSHVTHLKMLLVQLEISQIDVSQALGMNQCSFNMIVNGRRIPSPKTKHKIAEFLGTSPESLWPLPPRGE